LHNEALEKNAQDIRFALSASKLPPIIEFNADELEDGMDKFSDTDD
jgi:hypothetical protein